MCVPTDITFFFFSIFLTSLTLLSQSVIVHITPIPSLLKHVTLFYINYNTYGSNAKLYIIDNSLNFICNLCVFVYILSGYFKDVTRKDFMENFCCYHIFRTYPGCFFQKERNISGKKVHMKAALTRFFLKKCAQILVNIK